MYIFGRNQGGSVVRTPKRHSPKSLDLVLLMLMLMIVLLVGDDDYVDGNNKHLISEPVVLLSIRSYCFFPLQKSVKVYIYFLLFHESLFICFS